jgi:tocopherol cyclase
MAHIYRPEVFQGSLNKKNYFEGWYFKNVSADLNSVYSFIPGISLSVDDPHCFIQVINGITGKSVYHSYLVSKFSWKKNSLYLKIGHSVFTDRFIDIDIKNDEIRIKGHIEFINNVKYPRRLLSPGIMGWYSFIPFMECKHGIVSVNHSLKGTISPDGDLISFTGGKGYIEKDWGTSFPEAWIWMQANNFTDRNSSFSFSVAKIPWLGKFFIGFICFFYYNGKFHMYNTYNNSKISITNHTTNSLELVLTNNDSILRVKAHKSTFGTLMAPVSGNMSRRIKESVDSEVTVDLYDKNSNLICNDTSKRAGLEIIEKIFDYLSLQKNQ